MFKEEFKDSEVSVEVQKWLLSKALALLKFKRNFKNLKLSSFYKSLKPKKALIISLVGLSQSHVRNIRKRIFGYSSLENTPTYTYDDDYEFYKRWDQKIARFFRSIIVLSLFYITKFINKIET